MTNKGSWKIDKFDKYASNEFAVGIKSADNNDNNENANKVRAIEKVCEIYLEHSSGRAFGVFMRSRFIFDNFAKSHDEENAVMKATKYPLLEK